MDFTTLLNKGHKRYIEKHVRSRKLGRCEGCQDYCLLIKYEIEDEEYDIEWKLCNRCYDKFIFQGDI